MYMPSATTPLALTQLKDLNDYIFSELLRSFKYPAETDPRVVLDDESGRMPCSEMLSRNLKVSTAYPIWPREILIAGSEADHPDELLIRAQQLANCVRKAIDSGIENTDSKSRWEALQTTKLMAKFILPALHRLRDLRYINLSACYTTPPKDFIGLHFYKIFLEELFKSGNLKVNTAEFPGGSSEYVMQAFWKDLSTLNNVMQRFYRANPHDNEKPEWLEFDLSKREDIADFDRTLDNLELKIWNRTIGLGLCPTPYELYGVESSRMSAADILIYENRIKYITCFYNQFAYYRYKLRQETLKKLVQCSASNWNHAPIVVKKEAEDAARSKIIRELRELTDIPPLAYLTDKNKVYAHYSHDIKLLAALNYLANTCTIYCGESVVNNVPISCDAVTDRVPVTAGMYFSSAPVSCIAVNKAFTENQNRAMGILFHTNMQILYFMENHFECDLAKVNANDNPNNIYGKLYDFVKDLYGVRHKGQHAKLSQETYHALLSTLFSASGGRRTPPNSQSSPSATPSVTSRSDASSGVSALPARTPSDNSTAENIVTKKK